METNGPRGARKASIAGDLGAQNSDLLGNPSVTARAAMLQCLPCGGACAGGWRGGDFAPRTERPLLPVVSSAELTVDWFDVDWFEGAACGDLRVEAGRNQRLGHIGKAAICPSAAARRPSGRPAALRRCHRETVTAPSRLCGCKGAVTAGPGPI